MPSIPSLDDSGGVLFALLPGLLAYLVHNYLTVRSDAFEPVHAILWGLAATLVVQAIWWCAKAAGSWIPTPDVVGLPLTALAIGVISARLSLTGSAYRLLYRLGLTRGASQATVWHSSFANFREGLGEFAAFHLSDGKCYYGKICHYSRSPKDTHVLIDCYTLLSDCDNTYQYDPEDLNHSRQLLIPGDEIKYVEFIPHAKGDGHDVRPTTPHTPTTATATEVAVS